jgi:hypothetical protein
MKENRSSELYAFFDSCFPTNFSRHFTGEPTVAGRKLENWHAVWSMALAKYSDQEIEKAKQRMISRGINYPPSLPEFVELVEAGIRRMVI